MLYCAGCLFSVFLIWLTLNGSVVCYVNLKNGEIKIDSVQIQLLPARCQKNRGNITIGGSLTVIPSFAVIKNKFFSIPGLTFQRHGDKLFP